jgi:hypothetical protein
VTVFPWLVALLFLGLVAMLLVEASTATRRLARHERPLLARPSSRWVLLLLLVELVVVSAWVCFRPL